MNAVFLDPEMDDVTRRQALYDGQLIVYSPRPSSLALCAIAREMAEQAFDGQDPRYAQHTMPVETYATILAELKPKFIHHPKVKAAAKEAIDRYAQPVYRYPVAIFCFYLPWGVDPRSGLCGE